MYNYTGITPSSLSFGNAMPQNNIGQPNFSLGTPMPNPAVAMPVQPAQLNFTPSVPQAPAMAVAPSVAAPTVAPSVAATPSTPQSLFSQIWKTTDKDGNSSLNFDGLESLTKILGTAGTLFGAFQQQKLARDAFNFSKESFRTNIDNQRKTYNTALEDRIRTRYRTEGRSMEEADRYLSQNRL